MAKKKKQQKSFQLYVLERDQNRQTVAGVPQCLSVAVASPREIRGGKTKQHPPVYAGIDTSQAVSPRTATYVCLFGKRGCDDSSRGGKLGAPGHRARRSSRHAPGYIRLPLPASNFFSQQLPPCNSLSFLSSPPPPLPLLPLPAPSSPSPTSSPPWSPSPRVPLPSLTALPEPPAPPTPPLPLSPPTRVLLPSTPLPVPSPWLPVPCWPCNCE